jgi:hypothetical protein
MGWPGSRIRSTSRSRTDCTPATTPIRSSSWTTAGSLRSAGTSASSVLLDQDGAYARLFEPAPNRRENGTSGTMARMVLPTPLLHTDRLRLRPFDDADADALYAMQSSPHVLRYWDAPPWTERGRAQKFIAKCRKMAEDGIGARLAVDRLEDGAFIGWCSLTRWNPDYRSAALGSASPMRRGVTATRLRPRALSCSGPTTRWTSTGSRPRPTRATPPLRGSWRRSALCVRGRCDKTASSTATCRTRGCTG